MALLVLKCRKEAKPNQTKPNSRKNDYYFVTNSWYSAKNMAIVKIKMDIITYRHPNPGVKPSSHVQVPAVCWFSFSALWLFLRQPSPRPRAFPNQFANPSSRAFLELSFVAAVCFTAAVTLQTDLNDMKCSTKKSFNISPQKHPFNGTNDNQRTNTCNAYFIYYVINE
jgi:hypothetical protein